MVYAWKLAAGKRVDLDDFDPRHSAGLTKEQGLALMPALEAELTELQELCYAAEHHAVLIVLQGMDTSGKDGTIRHVMDSVNPQGCRVVTFKTPMPLELAHDFLWRVHAGVPPRGQFGIFNRSHYEDVLIVRVHDLVPKPVWQRRYKHINDFEQLLADDATIVLKFYLHISKKEQAARLLAREADKDKRWKLNAADYLERERWPEYLTAYEDVLSTCATPYAPWYVVPADRKWFRNLAVATAIVEALRPYRADWQAALRRRGEKSYQELLALRAQGKGQL